LEELTVTCEVYTNFGKYYHINKFNPCCEPANFNEQLRSYPLCTLKPEAVRTESE